MLHQILSFLLAKIFPTVKSNQPTECPNCWGQQEWACSYQDKPFDYDSYLRANGQVKPNFIREFVQQRLS